MKRLPFFVIALFLVGIFLRVDFVFYIAYVCIGVYLLSRWYVPRVMEKTRVKRTFVRNAFLGEAVPVTVAVNNQSWLALPWLQLHESIPLTLRTGDGLRQIISVPGKQSAELIYNIKPTRRGYYKIGPLQLRTGDLFGSGEKQWLIAAEYLTVFPRIHPLNKLNLPSRLPFGTLASHHRAFADPARPIGVRNFRSGDSLRQINWKVSARYAQTPQASLFVKKLEPAISLESFIVLDLDEKQYENETRREVSEWGIEVAASLAGQLTNLRQGVGIATNGFDPLRGDEPEFDEQSGRLLTKINLFNPNREQDLSFHDRSNVIMPRSGRAHLMKVLELLARIDTHGTEPFATWLPQATLNLSWGTTIIVITPNPDVALTNALHRLVRNGYNPILLMVQPRANFGLVRQRARGLGFAAYEVTKPAELIL